MHEERSNATKLICRIDVTAFLSVLLVLLFIFMFDIYQPDLPPGVDLPRVSHPVLMRGANREDAMLVEVQRDGSIWLGNDRMSLGQLPTKIDEAVRHGSERKVYLRVDARAWYGTVAEVLSAVRSAGVENIAFLVDERKKPR